MDRAKAEANLSGDTALVTFKGVGGARDQLGKASVQLMRRAVFGSPSSGQQSPELEFIQRMQLMSDERVWTVLPYRLDVR